MRTRFTSSALLAAVAAVGFGIAPALAAGTSNNSGYAFPDFWGNVPAQQKVTSAPAPNQAGGASIGIYHTQTSHGTWLFPPNPNSGSNG
jgi:hypothetical protein